jgi:hypothetical protein
MQGPYRGTLTVHDTELCHIILVRVVYFHEGDIQGQSSPQMHSAVWMNIAHPIVLISRRSILRHGKENIKYDNIQR